jgi:hypothetical protein
MSLLTTPRWFLLLLTTLATQVILMLADVIFVFYYAQFSKPGLEQAAYTTFAEETAGPFVFCFAPLAVYLIVRWLCRKAGRAPLLHAGLLVALYYLIDILIVIAFFSSTDRDMPMQVVPYLLNAAAMLGAALLAGWHARAVPAC